MTFHIESIDQDQQDVLRSLGPVAAQNEFYLGGGTAIALHLGHRRSVDFDWFTRERIADPMELAQKLRDEGIAFATGSVDRATLHGTVSGVRVSFFEYRYPLLQPLGAWSRYGCSLADLDDLACMKLSAIAQRGAKKDFVDLYALVTDHRPLLELINLYRRKYSTDDIAHLLYALTYFDDADGEQMPMLLWELDWETIKNSVRRWMMDIAE